MDNCLKIWINSSYIFPTDWMFAEMSWRSQAQERKLLRLLVKFFDATSELAPDPVSHARLFAAFRQELAELEMKEAARFRPIRKLVGFVFGRARA
jgi:hypothetical protein